MKMTLRGGKKSPKSQRHIYFLICDWKIFKIVIAMSTFARYNLRFGHSNLSQKEGGGQ